MWISSENGELNKPDSVEFANGTVIIRRNFQFVDSDSTGTDPDTMPPHWKYEEWQMTKEQYEVYQVMKAQQEEQADAILELADMIGGMLS